jgi:hypothetical protein
VAAPWGRLLVYAMGLAGPLLLLGSFAFRFDLGLDAPWYVMSLVANGYVPVPLVLAFIAWCAIGAQVAAVATGRYAPYPEAFERSRRGLLREGVRQAVLLARARRRRRLATEPGDGPRALEG